MSFIFYLKWIPLFLINTFVIGALIIFIFISRRRPKTVEIEERHASVILGRWIREFWFWLTDPLFQFFIRNRISPTTITIAGTVIAFLAAIAFAFHILGLGGWLMALGGSLDFFDGRVARATNRVTQSGSFADSVLDRISEGFVLTGLAYCYRNHFAFWIVMLIYLGSVLTSYTKARGEAVGVSFSGGLMQRPERIAYLSAGAIVFSMFSAHLQDTLYLIPLCLVAVLSNFSAVTRLVKIMKLLNKKEGLV